MDQAIRIRGLDHVVLRARDPARMQHFYETVLGCPLERRLDIGLIQLRAGASIIDLVPFDSELGRQGGHAPDHDGPNLDHFCVRVEPWDEAAIRAHLAGQLAHYKLPRRITFLEAIPKSASGKILRRMLPGEA